MSSDQLLPAATLPFFLAVGKAWGWSKNFVLSTGTLKRFQLLFITTLKAQSVWLKRALSKAWSKFGNCRKLTILKWIDNSSAGFYSGIDWSWGWRQWVNYCCIPFERQKYKITFWKRRKYHFTLCRKTWNFSKRFHADKFRILYACILRK